MEASGSPHLPPEGGGLGYRGVLGLPAWLTPTLAASLLPLPTSPPRLVPRPAVPCCSLYLSAPHIPRTWLSAPPHSPHLADSSHVSVLSSRDIFSRKPSLNPGSSPHTLNSALSMSYSSLCWVFCWTGSSSRAETAWLMVVLPEPGT